MRTSFVFMTVLAIVTMLAVGCAAPATPAPTPTPGAPTPAPAPGPPVPAPAPVPTPTAETINFRFLISDEVNAIADFEHLYVSISSIGVHQGGESGNWTEPEDFEPVEVDLKQLIADNATEIWSGNLTPGVYTKVFIHVDNITAVPEANIKLPSKKLQISKPFEVVDGEVTNFVYDVTIIKAGKSSKYILKPQIAQSGADQKFNEVAPQGKLGKQEKSGKPKDELELRLEGELGLGGEATLTVTDEGAPVEGATVTVNGEEVEAKTDVNGRLTIVLPDTPGEVKIKATFEDKKGELEIELEEPEEQSEWLEGTISTVDTEASTISIIPTGETEAIVLDVNPQTEMTLDGGEATLDDLAALEEGNSVTASYYLHNLKATRIDAESP